MMRRGISALALVTLLAFVCNPAAFALGTELRNGDLSESSGTSTLPWRVMGDPAVSSIKRSVDDLPEGMPAKVIVTSDAPLGGMIQFVDARDYRGKVAQFRGWMRVSGKEPHRVGLWLRADDAQGNYIALENMDLRIADERPWREYKIKLFIPPNAAQLRMGVLINGNATVEAGRLQLETPPPVTAEKDSRIAPLLAEILATIQSQSLRYVTNSQTTLQDIIDQSPERNSTDADDIHSIAKLMLRRLGDEHSVFLPPPMQVVANASPAPHNFAEPEAHMLSRDVSAMILPPFASMSEDDALRYAKAGAQALRNHQPRCGWIIDLQFNHGGNMWPMLSAIAELLPEGIVGQQVDREGRSLPWRQHRGEIQSADATMQSAFKPYRARSVKNVAVVLGPATMSSGEAVAIALRSRAGVRFFGQPSAGSTTSNTVVKLSDGSVLLLEVARFADVTGRTYDGPLLPDVVVPIDQARDAAAAWLTEACHADSKRR